MEIIMLLTLIILYCPLLIQGASPDVRWKSTRTMKIQPKVVSIFHHRFVDNSSSLSIETIKSVKYQFQAFEEHFTIVLHQHALGIANKTTRQAQCHFTGYVNTNDGSGAHFSLCHGMIGVFYLNSKEYFIEPGVAARSHPAIARPGSLLLTHNIRYSNVTTKRNIFSCKLLGDLETSPYIPKKSQRPSRILQRIKRSTDIEDYDQFFPLIDHDIVHEHIIELLIVVTSNLVKRFKNNLNEYILNNVAIATKMLRDPSIKTSISINVVDIIPLDIEYERLNNLDNWGLLTQDAVVDRFCHWIRYKKKYSKYVWDSAILINDGSFSTYAIGITHLRSMCAANNCIAVVDRGFGTGFIIAHEIGHQMNAPHDFDGITSCKKYEPHDQEHTYNTMMSTSLYFEHYPFKWSECSEKLINAYLRSDDSRCLKEHNKVPVLYSHEHIYQYHKNFSAGQTYDLDAQCTLAFGEPSEHCNTVEHLKSCSTLYCNPRRVGLCMRSQSIVGDGTPCDRSKKCIHGDCVELNSNIAPVDGGWTVFSDWSNCSRPCHGGVQHSERFCSNPTPTLGGRYCVGTRVQIKSCNIHNCEHDVDVREEICRKYNAKPYRPRVDEEAVCRLVCIKDNKALGLELALTDGTPCYAHRTDICVRSKCYKTGCDRVMSSEKVYDSCYVCGGKNDTCSKVNKFFDGSKISSSRSMMVAFKLPRNITNVFIKKVSERYHPFSDEVFDDYQILILMDKNTVIRRGESVEPFAGGELHYSGSNKKVETYRISGLIQQEIVVLIRTENPATMYNIPSVEYHYYIPNPASTITREKYMWKYPKINTSICMDHCSDMIRTSPICFNIADNVKVSDVYCESNKKLSTQVRSCEPLCGYRWQIPSDKYIKSASKNNCQVRCGDGTLMVHFLCQKKTTIHRPKYEFVPETQCFLAGLSQRPYRVSTCRGDCSFLLWSYGSWENCSVSCGSGFRIRTANCKDVKGRIWNSEECLKDLGGPIDKEECISHLSCKEETLWAYGTWSKCSKSCGAGTQTRPTSCMRKSGFIASDNIGSLTSFSEDEPIPDSFCLSYSKKPMNIKSCIIESCFRWSLNSGGTCSVTCGTGSKVFSYQCLISSALQVVVDDRLCFESGIERPQDVVMACILGSCYQPKWIKLSWGMCSETCGNGVKFRKIRCGYTTKDGDTLFLKTDAPCRNESRPTVMEFCQDVPCSAWKYGPWSKCDGLCLFGNQQRSVQCINEDSGSPLSFSECESQTQLSRARRCSLSTLCGHWKVGEWSKCSVSCGLGTRTRSIVCQHSNGTRSSNTSICQNPTPFDEVYCKNPACDSNAFWWLLKSSQCYASGCNPGVLYSDVRCVNRNFETLQEDKCNELGHPNYYTGCIKSECRQFLWNAEKWSTIPCSSNSCMMTIRNRRVTCVDNYGNVHANGLCDESTKPDDWRLCSSPRNCSDVPRSCKELKARHPDSADGEYSLAIDLNWTYFIYCADMKSENPTEYVTLKRPNYSRSSKTLSIRTNGTCTYQEEYEDHYTCPGCQSDESLRSITYYNKIRVNMSDLSIDIHDHRFSTTIGTTYVPYGTAKDCTGSRLCPQGHFLIDLSGTEFSVSMTTVWNEIYHNTGYRIIRTKSSQVVKGWCGGKCSGCAPLPKLYVEPQMYGRDLEVKSLL